jgi:hypothetical protein
MLITLKLLSEDGDPDMDVISYTESSERAFVRTLQYCEHHCEEWEKANRPSQLPPSNWDNEFFAKPNFGRPFPGHLLHAHALTRLCSFFPVR